MAVPDFIITALANIDHIQEEAPAWLTHHVPVLTIPLEIEETAPQITKIPSEHESEPENPFPDNETIPTFQFNWPSDNIGHMESNSYRGGSDMIAPFRPYNICPILGLNSQPHYNTDHYTPYPKYCPWSRPSHSLMAVHLTPTSWQFFLHVYHTATHLGASCISSPLYNPYLHLMLVSCIPHDSPSSYSVCSTYLGYAPYDSLMYYSIGYL